MHIIRLSSAIQIIVFILIAGVTVRADLGPFEEAAKLLPERIGVFRATGPARPLDDREDIFNGTSAGKREYQSARGERISVVLFKSASDSGAYAHFNHGDDPLGAPPPEGTRQSKSANVGTLGAVHPKGVFFFKGPVYVAINARELPEYSETTLEFAKQLAETLDKGEGDIPALVKHLPDWHTGKVRPSYAVNLAGLKENVPNQPVLEAISFEGGVEAVAARYDTSRLVIVEFNTPQLATENDSRIKARIEELRNQGQPAPTAYRRVGNYSVFVFDAPSEVAANQLIDQVKYQQVVQWLGKNPYVYEEAVREFTQTTLGVLVSVVKASGLVLLGSLAIGGFFGALLFNRRRAQQQVAEAYSDAGGMLRLNLDEIDSKTDPARALGPGN